MKYIIVAKNNFEGNSINDTPNPLAITEIATELVITRLKLIDMLQNNEITNKDCVVTIDERSCLYTKIFKNVISWKHFNTIKKNEDDTIIDLLENDIFNKMSSGDINERIIPYKPFYRNWERDKDLITNIEWSNLSEYDVSYPFISVLIRKRGAWKEKNMSDEYWTELINELKNNGKKVFVFGKETEKWKDSNNVQYVKNYQDWCTILKNPNCKHVVSTMTGGVYPLLIFGNKSTNMTLIDNTKLMEKHGGDPSFYDNCINFSKINIYFYNEIPEIKELYERITTNI